MCMYVYIYIHIYIYVYTYTRIRRQNEANKSFLKARSDPKRVPRSAADSRRAAGQNEAEARCKTHSPRGPTYGAVAAPKAPGAFRGALLHRSPGHRTILSPNRAFRFLLAAGFETTVDLQTNAASGRRSFASQRWDLLPRGEILFSGGDVLLPGGQSLLPRSEALPPGAKFERAEERKHCPMTRWTVLAGHVVSSPRIRGRRPLRTWSPGSLQASRHYRKQHFREKRSTHNRGNLQACCSTTIPPPASQVLWPSLRFILRVCVREIRKTCQTCRDWASFVTLWNDANICDARRTPKKHDLFSKRCTILTSPATDICMCMYVFVCVCVCVRVCVCPGIFALSLTLVHLHGARKLNQYQLMTSHFEFLTMQGFAGWIIMSTMQEFLY